MSNQVHMVVVCSLVRNNSGQILMIRHYKRGWEFPQGRVEECEDLMSALRREVREETGVEINPGPLACVWSKLSPPSAVIFGFLAEYSGGELCPSEESPEIAWVNDDEAMDRVTHQVNIARLKNLLDYSGTIVYRSYLSSPYSVENETVLGK